MSTPRPLGPLMDVAAGEAAAHKLYQAWRERCPVYLSLTKAMPVATHMGT